jgi:hypothetical protein
MPTRSSSASKIKIKSFDRSGHSTPGDDDMSQRSAPGRGKKKGSLDCCNRSETSRDTSQSALRRSSSTGTRRKKRHLLDHSNHSVASENERRSSFKSEPTDPQLDSGFLSPGSTKQRRKIKKLFDTEDEVIQPESFRSLP